MKRKTHRTKTEGGKRRKTRRSTKRSHKRRHTRKH
jgi:hypothetical protein